MSSSRYRVPKSVYYQCIWTVKDMDRLRRLEAADNLERYKKEFVFFVDDDEIIKDRKVLTQAKWKLDCIRQAVDELPSEYRQGTIDSIVYNLPFSDMAHENTWRKWRQVFIRELAKNLLLI